jgi:hypothetical protein
MSRTRFCTEEDGAWSFTGEGTFSDSRGASDDDEMRGFDFARSDLAEKRHRVLQ